MSIYSLTRRFVSVIYFNTAIADAQTATNNNDVIAVRDNLVRAIQFNPDPMYYRTLAQLDVAKMQQILATSTQAQSAMASEFQGLLSEAQAAATAAKKP